MNGVSPKLSKFPRSTGRYLGDSFCVLSHSTLPLRLAHVWFIQSHPVIGSLAIPTIYGKLEIRGPDLEAAREVFQDHEGGVQFVVDEAHSGGFLGPGGRGLVCELELEKEIAAAGGECSLLRTYLDIGARKLMPLPPAIILGNKSIRDTVINFGRAVMFSTAPTSPFVAAIKSGYKVLSTKEQVWDVYLLPFLFIYIVLFIYKLPFPRQWYTAEHPHFQDRQHVRNMAMLFFELLTSHLLWEEANFKGILSVPLTDAWEDRVIQTHLLAISTRPKSFWWLYYHLLSSSFRTFPVTYPVVPLGQGRLRCIIHAHNTEEQVKGFVAAIYAWVQEMMDIDAGKAPQQVTKAAKEVYEWMRQEQVNGFGMV